MRLISLKFLLFLLSFIGLLDLVKPRITCKVGYGQRGLIYQEGIEWVHTCKDGFYCFEGVTNDVYGISKMIDYPWRGDYYVEFYIRGCGGDYGTPYDWHPYKGHPAVFRTKGYVKFNLSTPSDFQGFGGSYEFGLHYLCRHDLCDTPVLRSGASRSSSSSLMLPISIAMIMTMASMLLFI